MTTVASMARVGNAGSGPSTARVGDANRVLLIGARVGTADAAPLDEAGASFFLFDFLSILSAQPLVTLLNQGYFCRKTLGMFKQT